MTSHALTDRAERLVLDERLDRAEVLAALMREVDERRYVVKFVLPSQSPRHLSDEPPPRVIGPPVAVFAIDEVRGETLVWDASIEGRTG